PCRPAARPDPARTAGPAGVARPHPGTSPSERSRSAGPWIPSRDPRADERPSPPSVAADEGEANDESDHKEADGQAKADVAQRRGAAVLPRLGDGQAREDQ